MLAKLLKPHVYPWLAFLVSAGLLLGALGFEHIGGLAPCQMCYWQRHAHKAIMIIALFVILYYGVTKNEPALKPLLWLIIIAALVSFGLGFWHMGVEYKWWDGPQSCMADPDGAIPNPDDIMKALQGRVKMPACSDVPWSLFGLSMAAYNAIISIAVAALGLVSLRQE